MYIRSISFISSTGVYDLHKSTPATSCFSSPFSPRSSSVSRGRRTGFSGAVHLSPSKGVAVAWEAASSRKWLWARGGWSAGLAAAPPGTRQPGEWRWQTARAFPAALSHTPGCSPERFRWGWGFLLLSDLSCCWVLRPAVPASPTER